MKGNHLVYILFTLHQMSCIKFDEMKDLGCNYSTTVSDLNADIILGVLIPIQDFRKRFGAYKYNVNAMTWVESIFLAIDQINKNKDLLPGIKLGYDIRNSCGEQELALKYTLEYMTDTKYLQNATMRNDVDATCTCRGNLRSKIAAVIGDYSSHISGVMSNLLSTDYLPQISYGATSPTLDDKTIFRSFLRTLPSNLYQTTAIVDLLERYDWTYVSALGSDADNGRAALDNLREGMNLKGMCLAKQMTFDPRFPGLELENIIAELKSIERQSNVVILWCQVSPAIQIIEAAYDAGLTNITWIATEAWGEESQVLKLRNIAKGNLSIIFTALTEIIVKDLRTHMDEGVQRQSIYPNPWLKPLWKELTFCEEGEDMFSGCMPVPPSGQYLPIYKHYNVMAAVYAIAHGIHKLFNCHKVMGIYTCPDKDKVIDYKKLYQLTKQSKFNINTSNDDFSFDANGDRADGSYTISVLLERLRNGKWRKEAEKLGVWSGEDRKINIVNYTTAWSNNKTKAFATCSFPCEPGSYRIPSTVSCCWKCEKCPNNEISNRTNQQQCTKCKDLTISNHDNSQCIKLTNKHLAWSDVPVQILSAGALLGVILTLAVFVVFIKYWESPVVKSSSREMSIIQIMSILLLFCLPLLFVHHISKSICVAQITCFGVLYAQIIAFILVKTYRLLRVFNKQRLTKISKYLQNRFQLLLCFSIVVIELLAVTIWYLVHPPHIEITIDKYLKNYVYHCGNREDILTYVVIGYVFFLSLVSGFMAFRARSLPENFNEAQFIWLAMFTTCLAWIVFIPLYLSQDRTRKPVVFLGVSMVSNFALLFLLYGNKVYIILFHPELNTQANFRKMAANVTVTTFLKETDPTGNTRPRQQSVISFDFDGMFDEYRDRQKPSLQKRLTIKLKKPHIKFPSMKRKASEHDEAKIKRKHTKQKKNRHKTVQLPKEKPMHIMQRSISLDDTKLPKSKNIEEKTHTKTIIQSDNTSPNAQNENSFDLNRQSINGERYEIDIHPNQFDYNTGHLNRSDFKAHKNIIEENEMFSPTSTNSMTELIKSPRFRLSSDSSQKSETLNLVHIHGITGAETFL